MTSGVDLRNREPADAESSNEGERQHPLIDVQSDKNHSSFQLGNLVPSVPLIPCTMKVH
jgi:hypothetical protein